MPGLSNFQRKHVDAELETGQVEPPKQQAPWPVPSSGTVGAAASYVQWQC